MAVVLSTTQVLMGYTLTQAKPCPLRLGEQTNWEWADGRPATIDYRDPVCAHQGPWAWGPRRRQLHAEYPRASHHRVSLQQLNPQEVEDGIVPSPFRRENPAIEKWKL